MKAMIPVGRYPTHGIGPVAQWMDINRTRPPLAIIDVDGRTVALG
jgi:hypothetical protein